MSQPNSRLGKGLSALIRPSANRLSRAGGDSDAENAGRSDWSDSEAGAQIASPTSSAKPFGSGPGSSPQVRLIRCDVVRPNPRQPRTAFDEQRLAELAESIRVSGVIQPILVRPAGDGEYELIAGERRLRAAKLAGVENVPAIVRELSDAESLEHALVENLQREDLGPLERASAYQQYLDTYRVTPEQLAARLGESRSNVVNYIRLLRLGPEIRAMLDRGELSMGHARALAGLADARRQAALAGLAVRRNLSVRQVEAMAQRAAGLVGDDPRVAEPTAGVDRHLEQVAGEFSRALGVPVELMAGRRRNSGRIIIRYNSLEQFELISERLGVPTRLD